MKAHTNVPDPVRSTATLSVLAARRIKPVNQFHLKTRQLTLLVRLDEERNLARAAAAAGLTQPAASKLLRQIESDFDVKLFDRHARGMAPTCYGEILARHARRALSEFGFARDEIVALKSGLSGRAAIGTVLSPGATLVPMAVVRMKERYPDVLTCVEIGSSRTLVQKLVRGELDMVVGRLLDSTPADELIYEPLAPDEPHAVIASAEHPLARRQDLQLEQLLEQPWILPPAGSLVRDRLATMLTQHGLSLPSNIVESQCLPVITALLQHGNMLAVLPEEAVQSCCEAGHLRVLIRNLPLGVGAFGLITRRHHKLSPAAQLLVSAVREQAGHLYPVASQSAACARMSVV
ncbi:MAG: transcriptional regulator, LysR family [Gammaproteobacteria bacterium]|nr:transcriptional regulator, LysR family [Gammaproteobacteria bacterium]